MEPEAQGARTSVCKEFSQKEDVMKRLVFEIFFAVLLSAGYFSAIASLA